MNQELIKLLKNFEDHFIERKLDSAAIREFRKTIVAFANCIPEGRKAVLFIGVHDDGKVEGVSNPDKTQKKITAICREDCYPPIEFNSEVIEEDGRQIVAVVIPFSKNRPHFSGPAFIRRGSQSIKASEEVFNELITTRLGKPYEILKHKDELITVITRGKILGETKPLGDKKHHDRYECRIEECTAHYISLFDVSNGSHVSEPLENVTLSRDQKRNRFMLIIQER